MKKLLLLGKFNETLKDLNSYLGSHYQVQLCSSDAGVFLSMLDMVKPDLVLISLIGVYDIDPSIFRSLSIDHHGLPVITIGTESERKDFLRYYEDEQFENLIRPVENKDVLAAVQRRIGTEEVSAKKRVLVVDDDPMMLRSVKPMLDEVYDVSLATSGMQAMTAIGRQMPDIILLDYEMPVCDGRQTLEMIRANEETASIPVIFLTGVNDREHIEAVLSLKPSGYLLKPPIKDILLAKLSEF